MLFTLEALEAKEGDSLLLHWGDPESPRLILIDGGPPGVYKKSLKPRLAELRAARNEADGDPDAPLVIDQLMISHIDSDHIAGILDMTAEMIREDDAGRSPAYDILTLWHNSFSDLVGEDAAGAAALAADVEAASAGGSLAHLGLRHQSDLVLANVRQGRVLRQNADKLGLFVNDGFDDLVTAPADGNAVLDMEVGLTFTVLGPSAERVAELKKQWKKDLPAILKKEADVETVAYIDASVANLSSIVVLAEADGKTMLLTGDARGDFVLEGLERAGLLEPEGMFPVDLLKMPHHGSIHNVDRDLFERIPALHYVFSANGKHDNPDLATLEMLADVRQDDDFTVWMTNHTEWSDRFFEEQEAAGRDFRVVHRDEDALSVVIDLGGDELGS